MLFFTQCTAYVGICFGIDGFCRLFPGDVYKRQLQIIIEQAGIPVVVDAGIGAPSHAAEAMELGASAVLVNTAIAVAGNPVEMAKAFKAATEAGRQAYEAGLGLQAVDFVAEDVYKRQTDCGTSKANRLPPTI